MANINCNLTATRADSSAVSNIHFASNVVIKLFRLLIVWTKKHLFNSLGRLNQKHNLIFTSGEIVNCSIGRNCYFKDCFFLPSETIENLVKTDQVLRKRKRKTRHYYAWMYVSDYKQYVNWINLNKCIQLPSKLLYLLCWFL